MATQDTQVSELIINTLTKAQYDSITPSSTELYIVTDEELYSAGTGIDSTALSSGTIQVSTTVASKTDIGSADIVVKENNSTIGTINANATTSSTIVISVPTTATEVGALPSSTTIGNGQIVFTQGGTSKGTISANQTSNATIDFEKTTVDSALDKTSHNPVENSVIATALEDISLAKNPNLNIIGSGLTVTSGNVSGFSGTNYLQFPFEFNFQDYIWSLKMSFTTGSDITTQQNILDSYYGVALAISGGHFILALSSNGTSWDIGNQTGSYLVEAETSYSVKIIWNGVNYTLGYSLDDTNYTTDITISSGSTIAEAQEYVGASPNIWGSGTAHAFGGTINLNKWELYVNNLLVWLGMDDVGLGSRANVSLSNLTPDGIDVIKANSKVQTINNISPDSNGNITLTASSVSALPSSTTIGDGQVIFQKNGTAISTISANQTTTTTVNFTIPITASDVNALPDTTTIPVVTSTYSASGTDAVNGVAVNSALSSYQLITQNMTALSASGTISLSDNTINKISATGTVTFSLPSISDTTKFHQIFVQLYMSSAQTINLSTTYYFDKTVPDLSTAGTYNLYYEYDNTASHWVVGVLSKGATS